MLKVYFLGTGGIYLEGEEVSVLADPFFTNPFPWRLYWPLPTTSDEELIERELTRLPGMDRLDAILVSHGHYDHAMDVPYIARRFSPLCVYGSETLRHAMGAEFGARFCGVGNKVNSQSEQVPVWLRAGERVRIAAVRAEHFSHISKFSYANGHYDSPLPGGRANRLHEWLSGEIYSFVIDVLDDSTDAKPVFRILYMPSAATHPIGTPPLSILQDGKGIDLAVLGASQLEKDSGYPGDLLACIQPAAVMMVHWENFFERYASRRLLNFRVDPQDIADRISTAPYKIERYWPERGGAVAFSLNGSGGRSALTSTAAIDWERCGFTRAALAN